jgi:glycosyltransferase involved in cell wall biosynthesis
MKVAIISSGHADSVIPMAKAISENTEVELFFLLTSETKIFDFIDFKGISKSLGLQNQEICKEVIEKEVYKYIDGKLKISIFIYKNNSIKSLSNIKQSIKLASILRKFDIIHVNGLITFWLQLRPLLLTKKVVYTVHDFENHSGERAKNFIARKYNPFIISSKSPVVIQNRTDYQYITENYPKHKSTVKFIPFGNLDIYNSYQNEMATLKGSDVLFFGRISLYKGIEYFTEAMKMLNKDYPQITYTIAGNGKFYFDDTDLKNDPNCRIYNRFIKNSELCELFKSCKIVVCPYIDATQSGVAMTAFTFNKPVIATNTGGFKDVIHDGINGYLVPIKDSKAIYAKLKLMFDQPEIIQQMELNIAKQGKEGEFAWKDISLSYLQIYKSLIK